MKKHLSTLLFLFLLGIVIFTTSAQELLTYGIPKVQTNVVIDGEINKREWVFSAGLPSFHKLENWEEWDYDTEILMQYDLDNLYLAFKIKRPLDFVKPRVVSPEETLNFAEDRIRIYLKTAVGKREIVANSEAIVEATNMNQLEYKTKLISWGWQGEIKIPLNLEGEGGVWLDFINDQATPTPQVTNLAYRRNLNDENGFWKIIPRGNNAVLFFEPRRTPQVDRSALWFRVRNNQEIQTTADSTFWVDHSRGSNHELRELWEQLEGMTPQEQDYSLARYSCTEDRFQVNSEIGRYLVGYAFRDAQGEVFAQGIVFFKNQFSMSSSLTPYFLTSNMIELVTSFGEELPAQAQLNLKLVPADDKDRILWQKELELDSKKKIVQQIPTTDCVEGNVYNVFLELKAENQLLADDILVFNRPPNPSWANNNLGKKAFILPPFEPIDYHDRQIDVWGRSITLGASLLPSRIVSQNEEILAAPINLNLEINQQQVQFENISPEVIEKTEENVTLVYQLQQPDYSIAVKLHSEFDGFLWYDFEIEPKRDITINAARLEIPVTEAAQLYSAYAKGTIPTTQQPMAITTMPIGGKLPKQLALPFYAYFWLGNEELGLQYFCESDQYWHVTDPQQVLKVEQKQNQSLFVVTFVDQNYQPKEKINYSFGLMASPVKPIGKRDRYWSTTTITWEGFGPNPRTIKADESFEEFYQRVVVPWGGPPKSGSDTTAHVYANADVKVVSVYGWNRYFGAPYTEDEGLDKKFKTLMEKTKEINPQMQLAPYAGWGINKNLAIWESFGTEMTRQPWEASLSDTMLQCANSSFPDFYLDGLNRLISEFGADGVYLDSTGNVPLCTRSGHGCGYVDDDGVLHGTYPIRATRELMKRIYKQTHNCGREGMVYLHTAYFALPIISFADQVLVGEMGVIAWDSLGNIDRDYYKAVMMGEHTGLPTILCWHTHSPYLKIKANQIIGFSLVHGQMTRQEPRAILNYSNKIQAPSYDADSYPLRHIYLLMDSFSKGEGTVFYPYWRNNEFIQLNNNNILASFYTNRDGETLVFLCNLVNSPQRATINFNLSKPISSVTDPYLDLAVSHTQNSITVDLNPQGYKILLLK